MPPKTKTSKIPDNDWLKVLYTETWKQYIHEDQFVQNRGVLFTSLFTAILASMSVFSPLILGIGYAYFYNTKIHLGVILLGLLWFFVTMVLRQLTTYFEKITVAGRGYVNVRSATLRIIEHLAGLDFYGPAVFEDIWREKSSNDKDQKKIKVLTHTPQLERLSTILPYNFGGSFTFFRDVIKTLRRVYTFFQIAGIILIIVGITSR